MHDGISDTHARRNHVMHRISWTLFPFCIALLCVPYTYGQDTFIERAHPSDYDYVQQQNELEGWYQALRNDTERTPPAFYRYQLPREETIIQIAALFSLPYDALATLNHLHNNEKIAAGSEIIIPSAPGLYIHADPINDFERLLYILRIEQAEIPLDIAEITLAVGEQEYTYRFIPGAIFSSTERSAFFSRLFHVPIRNGRVTSLYGSREDPISGNIRFHMGVDIAAPLSTRVRAAQEGRVSATVTDDVVYGNYVLIEHANGFVTLYAHLESITTEVENIVTTSSQIGTVGNSGHSTGAHIHFEIQLREQSLNPLDYTYIPRAYLIDGAENFKQINVLGDKNGE